MPGKIVFKAASLLYNLSYSLYKFFYFNFKKKQDAYEISLLKKLVKKGDVVLDIGANIGFFASLFSKLVGNTGKVICFEPDRKNFLYLQKTVGNKKNVILNEKAVSDNEGELKLYVSDKLNVDHRTYEPSSYKKSYIVKTVSIDNYLKEENEVSVVKMDIQGAEYSALKGMEVMLEVNPDIKIFMEFWPYGLKIAGTEPLKIYKFLTERGFKIYQIHNQTICQLLENNLNDFSFEEKDYYNVLVCKSLTEELK